MFTKNDVIYAYTRQDALADGVLVDAGPLAREAGFRVPVAMTAAAWGECVAVPDGVAGQDEAGRLWDVLTVLMHFIRLGGAGGSEVRFRVYVQTRNDEEPELKELRAVCGPDDDGSLCLTIMLPGED